MKYVNANVLPEPLLKEVQKYINGVMIYVPKPEGTREGWGARSGSRAYITQRNEDIRRRFAQGATVAQLAERFYLSCGSIKRIVYSKK
ncbi:hypothetical protein GXP70_16900 [Paenibacillus lycopersici]|uniref:Mor transcription activator domain-containing protein n=1 Tax=Paenibacillus lycopersici TaxID=2704462 RepID=A0A6C0FWH2_9BACL|nr:CD3324 family protein [Paenibacillus lycopersici]QHT61476.1 hypothetical protein GXP70_16900 [Paenibacillus lycopersici]